MPTIYGIAFPFAAGTQSFPNPAFDQDAIQASVIQIITTGKGERIMRPDFGCNAFSFVFENDSDDFQRMVEREIRSSLARWEPRIRVNAVVVQSGDAITEPGQVLITIYYTVIATQQTQSVSVAGGP
jgi:phage baseplate assembly protein W